MNEKKVNREYEQPFILNKSKLVRLCEVIDGKFAQLKKGSKIEKEFYIVFQNDKSFKTKNLEEIFIADNTEKNSLKRLQIEYFAKYKDESKNEVSVATSIKFIGQKFRQRISFDIVGEDFIWINELSAEIEEQIERAIPNDLIYRQLSKDSARLFTAMLPVLFFTVLLSITSLIMTKSTKAILLPTEKIKEFQSKISQVKERDIEQKIDFIYQLAVSAVNYQEQTPFSIIKDFKLYLVIGPILLIFALLYYLLKYCYPMYVFEWGDVSIAYSNLMNRKKNIWNIIFGSFILGTIVNLFVFGISGFFPK